MKSLRQPLMAYTFVVPVALWLGLFLSGCGSEPAPAPVAKLAPAPAVTSPADPTARMARAVGDDKPGAAVSIKYDFSARPQVGVPVEVEVVFLPTLGVDALDVTFTAMDGISLTQGGSASFSAVTSGQLYQHALTVLPERNGVFYVTASAVTRFGGSSLARTFAIPFVVGDQPAASKPTPQKDAKGQPIQPMKAEEPR